eukprot:CAMPEP_0175150160 /NCGR_PEP_ID=MMETSP0087-20121206/17694_1 /TAXON_ID=136419 /ORGANISM="Unknown Unknown, Strain D1" /LENGTH=399 /DNA_ID=CAMNT_0016436031 /DNA_START=100 /DNA_END=1297 /DNA_ORIENTATION=+
MGQISAKEDGKRIRREKKKGHKRSKSDDRVDKSGWLKRGPKLGKQLSKKKQEGSDDKASKDSEDDNGIFGDKFLFQVREEQQKFELLARTTHFDVATVRKLHEVYCHIAESEVDDGIVDELELTLAMGLTEDSLLARAIFRLFDIAGTRKVNFRTWVTTLSALSKLASQEERIKFSFSLFDLNGDGSIDKEELRSLLVCALKQMCIGGEVSQDHIVEICNVTLQDTDKDGNGTVEYSEYRDMILNSARFLKSFTLDVEKLCSTFLAQKGEEAQRQRTARPESRDKLTTAESLKKAANFAEQKPETKLVSDDDEDSDTEVTVIGTSEDELDVSASMQLAATKPRTGPAQAPALARTASAPGSFNMREKTRDLAVSSPKKYQRRHLPVKRTTSSSSGSSSS